MPLAENHENKGPLEREQMPAIASRSSSFSFTFLAFRIELTLNWPGPGRVFDSNKRLSHPSAITGTVQMRKRLGCSPHLHGLSFRRVQHQLPRRTLRVSLKQQRHPQKGRNVFMATLIPQKCWVEIAALDIPNIPKPALPSHYSASSRSFQMP